MSFFNKTASSTGENTEYTNGPGSGTHSEAFNQSQDRGAYSEMQSSQGSDDMGGGRGDLAGTEYSIRTLGAADTVAQLAGTPIQIGGGHTIRLDQLGTCTPRAAHRPHLPPLLAQSLWAHEPCAAQDPAREPDLSERLRAGRLPPLDGVLDGPERSVHVTPAEPVHPEHDELRGAHAADHPLGAAEPVLCGAITLVL